MPSTPLTVSQILAWADEHHAREGRFPNADSGHLPNTDEVWRNIDDALRNGYRGLRGNSSLARLFARYRDYCNRKEQPPLKVEIILKWADAWHRQHGCFPKKRSVRIPRSGGEIWSRINDALIQGGRGLPGGSTLAQLLATERGARNHKALPPLSIPLILRWCDSYHRRVGKWPINKSGSVQEEPGTTWRGVDLALRYGRRGLPGGSSLPQLLEQHRGVMNRIGQAPLTIKGIWAWAVSHHCRIGIWPTAESGRIHGTRWETWRAVDEALREGRRGLPGQSSLHRLLRQKLEETIEPKTEAEAG